MDLLGCIRQRRYLRGRWRLRGRRLRYEAGWDIALAARQILVEYIADCESPYFHCVHDDDLPRVRRLIERLDAIGRDEYEGAEQGESELLALAGWFTELANAVPYLWD